jgi:hypothetical protein
MSNYSFSEYFVSLSHTSFHLKSITYQKNKSVDMIKLNPQQWPDKAVTRNLFPPEDNYFTQFFAKKYREFLETNATTDDGMQYVASHYGVEAQQKSYLDGSSQDNRAKDYYKILHIIKTFSNQDFVWISFVEGLHRHAAIIMCLTCSRFGLEDFNINHDSLKKKDFKLAGVCNTIKTLKCLLYRFSMQFSMATLTLQC